MNIRHALFSMLLLSLAAPTMGAAAEEPALEDPALPTPGPNVWLKGAFGRVLGADPASPAAAPPSGAPLDAFVRRAPMTLEVDVPFEDLLGVAIASRLIVRGVEETLSDGSSVFEGPDTAGIHVITATVTTGEQGGSRHAWLVSVPDRAWTDDALFDITPPVIQLVSDGGVVIGMPGNGCYAYLCSDTGGVAPPATLEPLSVGVGETLAVRSGDGSALAGWTGRLRPLDDGGARPIEATGVLTDSVESMLALPGLEVPTAGRWLLELRVDFDRERGWQWHAYRLVAE